MAAGAAKVAVVAERKDCKMKKNYEENDLEIDTDMICDGMKAGMDSIFSHSETPARDSYIFGMLVLVGLSLALSVRNVDEKIKNLIPWKNSKKQSNQEKNM